MRRWGALFAIGLTLIFLFLKKEKSPQIRVKPHPLIREITTSKEIPKNRQISTSGEEVAVEEEGHETSKKEEKSCWEKVKLRSKDSDYLFRMEEKISRVIGLWYFEDLKFASPFEKFYGGLYFADLLTRSEESKISPEPDKAWTLLEDVAKGDPENSAPWIFLYQLALDHFPERAPSLLNKIEQTRYFNTYMNEVNFNLFSFVETPEDIAASWEAIGNSPIPDILVVKSFLLDHPMEKIGRQLIEDGLESENESNGTKFKSLEYVVGRSFLQKDLPDFTDTIMRKMRMENENQPLYFKMLHSGGPCEPQLLKEFVRHYRETMPVR